MSTTIANPNDLIPFGQAGLPAFLQGEHTHSTLDDQSIGASVDRITQGDGGIVIDIGGTKSPPQLSIDVVVLDAHPRGRDTYRAYYEGQWKDGEATAPACYSQDGRVPSPNAEKPQCSNCAACPMNVTGSGPNGEGRACGYFKHVAVLKYPEMDRIYRLKVSSRSLFSKDTNGVVSPLGGKAWGFNNFAKNLQQMKTPWESVVTRVSLPKGQTYGFFFTPIGYVQEAQYKQALAMQNDPQMAEVLTVEASASAQAPQTAPVDFLPQSAPVALPPAQPVPELTGRDKWLASATLPQNVKDWIVQVDDATAIAYLTPNYPNEL